MTPLFHNYWINTSLNNITPYNRNMQELINNKYKALSKSLSSQNNFTPVAEVIKNIKMSGGAKKKSGQAKYKKHSKYDKCSCQK